MSQGVHTRTPFVNRSFEELIEDKLCGNAFIQQNSKTYQQNIKESLYILDLVLVTYVTGP